MSGAFSVGGLISGLDSNSIISQLMQIERAPINRIQRRIDALEKQRTALRDLRTQLQTLTNKARDFELSGAFSKFKTTSSTSTVLTSEVSGENPVAGAYIVQVIQLASATIATSSARLGASIDPGASLAASGISTAVNTGAFSINGISFNVDPAVDSLNTILANINASGAGVTATYDALTDKVTFENTTPGNTALINFGATGDTSNFLTAIGVKNANQSTGINGSTVASSTVNLGAVQPGVALNTVNFGGGAATSGAFYINGVAITVDVTTDSLSDVIQAINDSDAQVTASYDSTTDGIRLVSDALGSRTISLTGGTSNFLTVTNLTAAVQTAGIDSQFTVNSGPVQTRNTNKVADAIGGVTLNLLSAGASTVTVAADDDAIVEDLQEFVDEFNKTVDLLRSQTVSGGLLENDGSIRSIDDFLRNTIFDQVPGIAGSFASLLDIGITTGGTFDSDAVAKLNIDADKLRASLRADRSNVQDLFANSGGNGVANRIEDFLREATASNGYLNDRVKSNGTIDSQVESFESQIERLEDRLAQKEIRLRRQFARLEQLSAGFQQQGSALSRLGGGLRSL